MKICVVGLGRVGLPVAEYIKSKGLKIYGHDINPIAVEKARQKGITAFTDWDEVPLADIYLICVSTSFVNNMCDLSPLFDACKKIAQKTNSSILVSIESTVIPGTCRKIYKDIFGEKVHLIHVPHRYWAEDPIKHGVKQLRVIGAINLESLERGLRFYKDTLEIPLYIVSSIEIAEISKIAENAYRYVQISFAEELRMICEELGLDFKQVREACNTKWNIEILEARDGIGGDCLPKDIRFLASLTCYNTLLNSAIATDYIYREWLLKRRQSK